MHTTIEIHRNLIKITFKLNDVKFLSQNFETTSLFISAEFSKISAQSLKLPTCSAKKIFQLHPHAVGIWNFKGFNLNNSRTATFWAFCIHLSWPEFRWRALITIFGIYDFCWNHISTMDIIEIFSRNFRVFIRTFLR